MKNFSGTIYVPTNSSDTEEDKELKKEFAAPLFKDYPEIKVELGNDKSELELDLYGNRFKL